MRRLSCLMVLAITCVCSTSFVSLPGNDNGFCEDVKKIVAIFSSKEFSKIKGKVIDDASDEKSYISAIELKGYISQLVMESENQIYFAAVLNQDYKDAKDIKIGLGKLVMKFESCLGVKMDYSETRSFMHYTYVFESGVEVKVSASYPDEKRRQLDFEITYRKEQ